MFEQINAQIPTHSRGEMSLIANSLKNKLRVAHKSISVDFEEREATRADVTDFTRARCMSKSKCGSKGINELQHSLIS